MTLEYRVLKGATNVSVTIRIIDSTDGTPELGVVAATTGLVLNYRRELAANVSLATITNLALLTTAHTDKGILHIGNGYYRVDVPDAAFATGVTGVLIHGLATGMVVVGAYAHLIDVNDQDGVRMGLTALPNAVVDAAGGLATSAGGATGIDDLATPTNITAGTITTVTTLTNLPAITANWLTAAGIAASALDGKGNWNIGKTGYALTAAGIASILTTQMTESYAANGTAPTLAQAQFAMHQMLMQFGIASTSLTVRKLDDTTTAFVVTLDDATAPTDAKRV